MSFQDSAFIFFIALLLFGPKKLPELARQLGKLMGEFRRASAEFRMQLDDELRSAEQADKQKQIEALAAANPTPLAPSSNSDPAEDLPPHPHAGLSAPAPQPISYSVPDEHLAVTDTTTPQATFPEQTIPDQTIALPSVPAPIATSGDLHLHPPATGLPVSRNGGVSHAFDSLPEAAPDRSSRIPDPRTPDPRPAAPLVPLHPEETAQHG